MSIIDTGAAYQGPCQEWVRGPLRGSLHHAPIPAARLAGTVEVDCARCGAYLYTYKETTR